MSVTLNNNEKLILNKKVVADQDITALSKLQHNYFIGSNQAKMMITGQFNIAQQWLFKAGSAAYNGDGELIDYSGEGNDAALTTLDIPYFDFEVGQYYDAGYNLGTASKYDLSENFSVVFYINRQDLAHTYQMFFSLSGAGLTSYKDKLTVYLNAGRIALMINCGQSLGWITAKTLAFDTWYKVAIVIEGTTTKIYFDDVLYDTYTTIAIPYSAQTTSAYLGRWHNNSWKDNFGGYIACMAGFNKVLTLDEIKSFGMTKPSDMDSLAFYLYPYPDSNQLIDLKDNTKLSPVSRVTVESGEVFDNYHYNLINGFTDYAGKHYPYLANGNPSQASGVNHPAGNWHNGAETKIILQGYVAKTYDELKALAITDNRFELVEDEDGNISELKVTKLTETDTEHYTADNNNQQTLMESGNLTSLIDQTVKLLIQGGDNDNIAAAKTITLPSGGEITITAATSGEDGNNIQIVFVVGGTRGITVVEGSTIIITLTYEAGDDLSDCTDELDSVATLVTYSIDTDGALSDDSGSLEGGFTPAITLTEYTVNGDGPINVPVITPYEKNWKLIESESFVINKDVVTNENIEFEILCSHNYSGSFELPYVYCSGSGFTSFVVSGSTSNDWQTITTSSFQSPSDQTIKLYIYGGENEISESYIPTLTVRKVTFQGNQIKYPVISKKYGNKLIGTFT